jgi:hypothetical protein
VKYIKCWPQLRFFFLKDGDLGVMSCIWTLKEQCVHRQRFDSIQHATRAIGDWISFYNHRRPHQAVVMRTPCEAFNLAA